MSSAHVLAFINDDAFDANAVSIIGMAFDRTRTLLQNKEQPTIVQELIAKRIVHMARAGERDPDVLARRTLRALGLDQHAHG
jgi:hypothetical protein